MQELHASQRASRAAFQLVFSTVGSVGPLFRTAEALASATALGMSPSAGYQAIAAAARGGVIERLRSGLYLAAPPLRAHEPHEFVIATRAVPGSVIAGVSALSYWGLIDQAPMRLVTAVVPRGVVVRRSADAASESEALLPAGLDIRGLRYVYRRIAPEELVGVMQVQLDDALAPIFDRERMAMDAIIHPRVYGVTTGPFVLSEHHDELDTELLEHYAAQLGATVVLEHATEELEAVAL